tara:strand:+ start:53288 stop:54082 length:795 start_codon:yes stop_codon:yes gene_type:complete
MIDFHNHILPNQDDGSNSLEVSLSMLKHAADQGITDVVNTVHFQHPKVDFLKINNSKISSAINNLQEELNKRKIPITLHFGAEVFYLPNLLDIIDNPLVTFGKRKYILIEFSVYDIPRTQKQVLYDLKIKGITPIIAHPERYKQVQENIYLVYDWLNSGCLIQVDAGSIIGTLGKKSKIAAEKIINNNWCQILGSDAHDNHRRNFCLREGYELVQEMIGVKYAEPLVNKNPRLVIEGKSIYVDIDPIEKESDKFWQKLVKRLNH